MSRGQRSIWAVLVVVGLLGCDSADTHRPATPTGPPSTDVVVESQAIVPDVDRQVFGEERSACYVRGTIRNVTRRTLHADVTFLALGPSGKAVGEAAAGVDVKGGARAVYSGAVLAFGFGGFVLCDRIAQVQVATLVTCDLTAAVHTRSGDSTSPVFCPL